MAWRSESVREEEMRSAPLFSLALALCAGQALSFSPGARPLRHRSRRLQRFCKGSGDAAEDGPAEEKKPAEANVPVPKEESAREYDALLDVRVERLLREKEALAARGDFEGALKRRNRLSTMQLDDSGAVLSQNAEFYRAFSKRDLNSMKDLWHEADDATCIHPGSKIHRGHVNIVKAWDRMFRQQRSSQQSVPHSIKASDIKCFCRGTMALVTCTENIYHKESGAVLASLYATNVYRLAFGQWKMVHHHASPVTSGASQMLGGGAGAGALGLGSGGLSLNLGGGNNLDLQSLLQNRLNGGDGPRVFAISSSGNVFNFDDDDDDDDIVMASDDDDDDDDLTLGSKDIAETIRDAIKAKLESKAGGDGSASAPEKGKGESKFVNIGDVFSAAKLKAAEQGDAPKSGAEGGAAPGRAKAKKASGEELRNKSVALVRRLAGEGSISGAEKTALLGDIIRSKARGDTSLVETACEVLLDGEEEDEAALQDFRDQCTMLARDLGANKGVNKWL